MALRKIAVNVEGNSISTRSVQICAIQTTHVLHSVQRDGIRRGIVTMCIGG